MVDRASRMDMLIKVRSWRTRNDGKANIYGLFDQFRVKGEI